MSRKVAAVPFQALRVHSFRDGETHVIALAGELDLSTMNLVERELERVEGTDAAVIVVDLRELEFMDSSGLRVIVMAYKREPGRLSVVKGPRCVQRVFEICGMVSVLPLIDQPPAGDGGAQSTATTRRGRARGCCAGGAAPGFGPAEP